MKLNLGKFLRGWDFEGTSELQGWEGRQGEILNQSLTDFERACEAIPENKRNGVIGQWQETWLKSRVGPD